MPAIPRFLCALSVLFLGAAFSATGLSSRAFADGYLNDAATTRHWGGVGNYLFHEPQETATAKEIREAASSFVEVVSFSQSAPLDEDAARTTREVYFSAGSTRLSASAEATLDSIAEELKSNSELKVELSGFADSRDGHDLSQAARETLSSARAKTVMEALRKKGVGLSQIFWTGKGVLPAGPENRRVEIRFQ